MRKNLMIDCQAEGIPPPTHQWKKAVVVGPATTSTAAGGSGSGSSTATHTSDWLTIVSGPHIHVLENGSLVIIAADKSDEGEYVCGASSIIGSITSSPVHVHVRVPAHIKNKSMSSKTKIGEKVSLVCEAYGDEPIKIVWSKGNEIISNSFAQSNKKFVVQENAGRPSSSGGSVVDVVRSSTLVLEGAALNDSGFYACTASNAYGREEMSFQLIVQSVPEPPTNIRILEINGRQVVIGWKEGPNGNSPIIEYLLQYKKKEGNFLSA